DARQLAGHRDHLGERPEVGADPADQRAQGGRVPALLQHSAAGGGRRVRRGQGRALGGGRHSGRRGRAADHPGRGRARRDHRDGGRARTAERAPQAPRGRGVICYGPRVYEGDVLAGNWRRPGKGKIPQVPAELDLVVEDADSGFCGAVVACDKEAVTLEDRFGNRRLFPLAPAAFLLEGRPVTLVRPTAAAPKGPRRSASGSIAVEGLRARVARESRIYVEGVHDAALVEKIWGHDLRV